MAFKLPTEIVQIERLAAELSRFYEDPAEINLRIFNHDDEVPWQYELEGDDIPMEWWEKKVFWAIQYAEGEEAPEIVDFGELDKYDEPPKTELSEFASSNGKTAANPYSI